MVGTSRGTESAAYVAIHSRVPVDGLILTSPITVSNRNGTNINVLDLDKICIPVQIVYHENDGCRVTPPWGAKAIGASLPNARAVEVKAFSGGGPALSGACQAKSEHGFLYIEEKVVESIAAFIKANK